MRYIAIFIAAGFASSPAFGAQDNGPCGESPCPNEAAKTLQDAWAAAGSTSQVRGRISWSISSSTHDGVTDWSAALKDYNDRTANSEYNNTHQKRPDYRAMRLSAERGIRAQLVDPDSAQFSWPNGFTNGSWKPFLGRTRFGYVTCGMVNARNRMGGYTGPAAFVVVVKNMHVEYLNMDRATENFGVASARCAKSHFPAPQKEMFAQPKAAQTNAERPSLADELEKLAKLKEQGALTDSEYQTAKSKLLEQ